MAETELELQQVGNYGITRLLHASSTSSLYLGKQQRKKEPLVLRVFHTPLATTEAREAFLARAKQLKKLKHRFIVEVYDFGLTRLTGKEEEYPYLAMQYVEGQSLAQRMPRGKQLATDEVKRILSPIASTLHYAHVSNIVHANLHPGNLLAGPNNETLLGDFSPLFEDWLLPSNQQIAAIPYMAPEQLRGTPTAASDQYALAVMVYEWLCGQRPYQGAEREQLLYQQEHDPLPAPRSLNSNISPAIEAVLLHALSPDPADRFPNTQAFADAYLHALMGLSIKLETSSSQAPDENFSSKEERGLAEGTRASAGSPRHAAPPTASIHRASTAPTGDAPSLMTPSDRERSLGMQFINSDRHTIDQASHYLLEDTVVADLREGGILSQSLPGYEERQAQIEMATLVARALTEGKHAITEASTGTGKGLAYLVPIVRSGKVAIISTANKALQEQLFYKDIPFVQQHIQHVEAALVKGVGNYVCIDRLENERTGLQFYAKNREFMRLVDITNDPDAHFNGDFEMLDFQLPPDIRSHVCADSDQCAWTKCNYYADCYVRQMRDKAARAQIIVVNHTLLLLDAAMGGYLLPKRDVIVLDEAHHLEEEATRAFTITISPNSITTLLAQRLLKDHSEVNLQDQAEAAMKSTWQQLQLVADPGYKGRANLLAPLEEGLKLASIIDDLAESLRKQRPKILPEKEDQLYDKLVTRTQNLAINIRVVFSVAQPDKFVYYVERVIAPGQRGNVHLQVSAAPLDVTTWLQKNLFDKSKVICTSATLATVGPDSTGSGDRGPNFAYFRRRVGLHPSEYPHVIERILPLTFDYENNALLYLPRDLPEPVYGNNPASDEYARAIARKMYSLVKLSRGRAFLLFSSKRMLDQAYDLMAPHLDFPLLKQGDLSRIEMTRRFREDKGSVLFGLKSFWEGVDIPGEALSMVVIDKLPFDPPDDPVHEARVAQMKAAGENWFGTYVLPQAVLRLKQGLGRLLRTREDRGVMAILDARLHTKGYGKLILDALPPARRTSNIRDVERFFAEAST